MRFIETPTLTRVITVLLDDEAYRELQSVLMRRPEAGVTIAGTSGARKMRWGRDLTAKQARMLGALIREEFK